MGNISPLIDWKWNRKALKGEQMIENEKNT